MHFTQDDFDAMRHDDAIYNTNSLPEDEEREPVWAILYAAIRLDTEDTKEEFIHNRSIDVTAELVAQKAKDWAQRYPNLAVTWPIQRIVMVRIEEVPGC